MIRKNDFSAEWKLNRAVEAMGKSPITRNTTVYKKLKKVNDRNMATICQRGGCKTQAAPSGTGKRGF